MPPCSRAMLRRAVRNSESVCTGTSGRTARTTFQQKPQEVFADGAGMELRGNGQGWLWPYPPRVPTPNRAGRTSREGSEHSQHGCAQPGSRVNTE